MDNEISELLEFKAYAYELKESNALELKKLLNSIPDDKLMNVVVCDKDGDELNDVMFSVVGKDYQKAIVF